MDNEPKESFSKSFIKGEATFGFWNIASKALGFLGSILVVKYTSLYEFGVYQLVLAFHGLIGSFFMKLLSAVSLNDILRFIGEKREDLAKKLFHQYAFFKISIGVFVFASVFWGAEIIASYYDENVADFFRIVSFLFLVDAAYDVMKVVLESRLSFSSIASRSTIYQFLRIILLIATIVFLGLSIKNILIVNLVASATVTVVFLPIFLKKYKIWSSVVSSGENVLAQIMKKHGKWGLIRPFFAGLSDNIRPWLIKIFISTEAVAIFNLANVLLSGVKSILPINTFTYLIPLRLHNKKNSQKIFSYSLKYITIFSIVLGIASFFGAFFFVKLIIPEYAKSLPIFYIMLLSMPFSAFGSVVASFLIALRKQKYLFFQMLFKTFFSTVACFVLVFFFGLFGLATETILTSVVVLSAAIFYIHKIKPGPVLEWKTIFSFNRTDTEFLRNVLSDAKKYIRKHTK